MPVQSLYWDFLSRNQSRLKGNNRLAMPYRALGAMTDERRREIATDAKAILESDEFSPNPR